MGALIALAAAINTGNPADLPSAKQESAPEARAAAAETATAQKMQLWDGKGLTAADDFILIPEATATPRAKMAAENVALKTKAVISLAVSSSEVKAAVDAYFSDIPIMKRVAQCESQFRQYDAATGEVLRGRVNSQDRGVMQINEMYHREAAEKLGMDIMTLEGNMAYARHLYETQGTQPWISSSPCWAAPSATDQLAAK